MGVLAHALERQGLATVGLSLVRGQSQRVRAPRFLHNEFPLGRPLGRPNDPEGQTDVLRRALALVPRTDVPVWEEHPEVIADEGTEALACALPPRLDPNLHPALDEVAALRPAYERQVAAAGGRTSVGHVAGPDGISDLVGRFVRIVEGASLDDVGLAETAVPASRDVRAYYEEAALALADHTPGARQAETWLYHQTETGKVLREAQQKLREAEVDRSTWYYVLPMTQR